VESPSGAKNRIHVGTLTLPTIPIAWRIAGVGDFNGDGNADLVWENTVTGQRAIWLLKNGVFSSGTNSPTVPGISNEAAPEVDVLYKTMKSSLRR
jgi:FG-GAP repeat